MKKGVETICYKCKYKWNYKGKQEYYLTCPHCYNKLNVKRLEREKNDRH